MNRSPRTLALCALLLCALPVAWAQHGQLPDSTQYSIRGDAPSVTIPMKVKNNHVLLSVSINGNDPVDVVLDTGMPVPGLVLYGSDRTDALKLDFDPNMNLAVGGAGGHGKTIQAQLATDETLTLGDLKLQKTGVLVLDRTGESSHYHDGIIGYSIFSRYVVELDYDAGEMHLHEPASFKRPEGAVALPIVLRGNMPFVEVGVTPMGGKPYSTEVVVDLGASHAISLHTDAADKISLPATRIKTALGRGLSGKIEGHMGRVAELRLGSHVLSNVLASFPQSGQQGPVRMDSRGGNLGNGVLRRFRTLFDYSNNEMLLVAHNQTQEPFLFDMSGIALDPGRSELEVAEIITDSPAATAGLQAGDIITHVDGRPVSVEDRLELRESWKEPGRRVAVQFRRGDANKKATFTLQKLL